MTVIKVQSGSTCATITAVNNTSPANENLRLNYNNYNHWKIATTFVKESLI